MSWKNIVGHEAAVRLLKGQLSQGRLAHTYLFVGQRGIGKKALALEFVRALECREGSAEGCGVCESCRRIGQGTYPDLMRVGADSKAGQTGIDQVRALAGWISLTPYEARWKVGLIEEADRLTEEAAHACLKLLEEPPEHSILLLTAAGVHRLPSTLVSRCHIVRCAPQGIRRVAQFLQEGEKLEPAQARMMATWSGGRLGQALESHRQQRLGIKNELINQLLTACRQKQPEVPLGNAPRAEVEEALEWLAAWWRDLLLLALQGDPAWVIHQDRLEELRRELAAGPSREELLDRVEWTYRVQEAVQRNASPRIALATLLCR